MEDYVNINLISVLKEFIVAHEASGNMSWS